MGDESIWDIIESLRQSQDPIASKNMEGGAAPVLIGDSHTAVILAAARRSGFDLRGAYFAIGPQPPHNDDITALHPDLVTLLQSGPVFSGVSQSMHDVLTLLQHPRPFDLVSPLRPDLSADPSAVLIPYGALLDALRRHMHRDFKVLGMIQSLCQGRLVHILSPPPLEDNHIVAATSPWPLKSGQSISSPNLRLKVYDAAISLFVGWCSANGVGVIPPPPQAVDERGFLRPDYRTNATHGNVAYGRLVLEQMRATL